MNQYQSQKNSKTVDSKTVDLKENKNESKNENAEDSSEKSLG